MTIQENIQEKLQEYKNYEYTVQYKNTGPYWKATYSELTPEIVFGYGDTKDDALIDLIARKNEWLETWLSLGINVPIPNNGSRDKVNVESLLERLGLDISKKEVQDIIINMIDDEQYKKFRAKIHSIIKNGSDEKEILKQVFLYSDPLWLLCLKLLGNNNNIDDYYSTLTNKRLLTMSWGDLPINKENIEKNIVTIVNEINIEDTFESLYHIYIKSLDENAVDGLLYSNSHPFGPLMILDFIKSQYSFPEEFLTDLSLKVFNIFKQLYDNKGNIA